MEKDKMFIVTIAHIPQEDLMKLSAGCIRVADAIFRINAVRRKATSHYNCWIHPSRKHLSVVTGLCETYVSRCVSKLERLGIIQVSRSKKRNGHWRINWYQVGERVIDLCNAIVKHLPIKRFNGMHKTTQQLKKKELIVNSSATIDECRRALRRFFGTTHQFSLK